MWATLKQWRLIKWEMICCGWMLLAATDWIDPKHRMWHLGWLLFCLFCYCVEYWLIGMSLKLKAELKDLDKQIKELEDMIDDYKDGGK